MRKLRVSETLLPSTRFAHPFEKGQNSTPALPLQKECACMCEQRLPPLQLFLQCDEETFQCSCRVANVVYINTTLNSLQANIRSGTTHIVFDAVRNSRRSSNGGDSSTLNTEHSSLCGAPACPVTSSRKSNISLAITVICKASSDNYFAFLHFFFWG